MNRPHFSNNVIAVAVCAAAMSVVGSGCCNGFICSQRFYENGENLEMCGDGGPNAACGMGARQCVARLFGREDFAPTDQEMIEKQQTIRPPHSRFHPLPTQPVFQPRAEYSPPRPLNMKLEPAHDQAPALEALPLPAPQLAPVPATAVEEPRISRREPTPQPALAPKNDASSANGKAPTQLNRPQNAPEPLATAPPTRPAPASGRLISVRILDDDR